MISVKALFSQLYPLTVFAHAFIVKTIVSFLLQTFLLLLNPNIYHGRDAYNALNMLLRICIKHIRIFPSNTYML